MWSVVPSGHTPLLRIDIYIYMYFKKIFAHICTEIVTICTEIVTNECDKCTHI